MDDDEAVRFEYIKWMKGYGGYWLYGLLRKAGLLEHIDRSVIEKFDDYYPLEGIESIFNKVFDILFKLEV